MTVESENTIIDLTHKTNFFKFFLEQAYFLKSKLVTVVENVSFEQVAFPIVFYLSKMLKGCK